MFASGAPAEVPLYTLVPKKLAGRNHMRPRGSSSSRRPERRAPRQIGDLPDRDDARYDAELLAQSVVAGRASGEWHDACKNLRTMSNRRVWGTGETYRAATELAGEESCVELVRRRRAARWHAWLTSPECTFQDRENFERWCGDAMNAAAYAALCGNLAAFPDAAIAEDDESAFPQTAYALGPPGDHPRLRADAQ